VRRDRIKELQSWEGNPHIGSSFDSWLDEEGIREEVTAAAIKAVIPGSLQTKMKKKNHQAAGGLID
jgi:hypothetical protein